MLRNNTLAYFAKIIYTTSRPPKSVSAANRFYATATSPAMDPFQEQEMMSHKLILVDENDRVVGSETKLNCHLVKNGNLPLHRAFSVLLFNSKNELVLQQRSATKAFVPNHVTNACCSHPLYDAASTVHRAAADALESTRSAAVDRLIFELGIPSADISAADLQFVGRILYKAVAVDVEWGEHELDYIFVLRKDLTTMTPHPMEVKQVWSVPRNEFVDFIRNLRYPLTPWFKILIKDWLFRIWDSLDNLEKISEKDKIHKYTSD